MDTKPQTKKIVIAGAGSIGCFIGGILAANKHDVHLLGRPRIIDAIKSEGLSISDCDDNELSVAADNIGLSTSAEVLKGADIIMLAAKSSATEELAAQIKEYAPQEAIVMSLQNGVQNPSILRQLLPNHRIVATMIPFNVVQNAAAHFHRGTAGREVFIDNSCPELSPILSCPQLAYTVEPELEKLQWGKLLINLNNALNALSDLPLLQQLEHRQWRKLFARLIEEGMQVLTAEGVQAKPMTPVSLKNFVRILRLPNFLFRRVAAKMLTIDAEARSSMWEDLKHRRLTEIDEFQGLIVKLAQKHSISVPINQKVLQCIRDSEKESTGSPALNPKSLLV